MIAVLRRFPTITRHLVYYDSSECAPGLPGLLLEQLQQVSMLVLSRLYTQQPGQGKPQVCQASKWPLSFSQCTPGTVLSGWELLACSWVFSPLLVCIASLCGKTTSMCPSLRYNHLPLTSDPQHLNRQTSPQPYLSPLTISSPGASCLRPIHLSISPLGS